MTTTLQRPRSRNLQDEGVPNVTDTFSVLRRAMHCFFYDDLPYSNGPSFTPELLYAKPVLNHTGEIIAHTTAEFQKRETAVVKALFEVMGRFTEDQRRVCPTDKGSLRHPGH